MRSNCKSIIIKRFFPMIFNVIKIVYHNHKYHLYMKICLFDFRKDHVVEGVNKKIYIPKIIIFFDANSSDLKVLMFQL